MFETGAPCQHAASSKLGLYNSSSSLPAMDPHHLNHGQETLNQHKIFSQDPLRLRAFLCLTGPKDKWQVIHTAPVWSATKTLIGNLTLRCCWGRNGMQLNCAGVIPYSDSSFQGSTWICLLVRAPITLDAAAAFILHVLEMWSHLMEKEMSSKDMICESIDMNASEMKSATLIISARSS